MQDNKITTEAVGFRIRTINGITEVFPQRFFGIMTIICLVGALGLVLFAAPNATGFDLAEKSIFYDFYVTVGDTAFAVFFCREVLSGFGKNRIQDDAWYQENIKMERN